MDGRRVVLLHGIWMVGATMQWFGARLREAGFVPETFGYHSIVGGPEQAVPQLVEQLRGGGEADIVAHSLGGLIALQALAAHPDLPVTRVVCLGVPLCGSAAASALSDLPVAGRMLGRSAPLLQQGCAVWPQRLQVGMIAGRLPHGLGALFAHFEGEHDGTVSVEETRAAALADHVLVEAGHSGLLFSAEAARHAIDFLRDGHFRH
ncbi:pimeloyl-ACP methyl ester carboxylesterase [Luteimonas cucumeris]|uniref:Pimeloyl-ACP methyl ester carboxylesterase n=1 Tax=Luteimonas cucumeris TaxID=985012 RepID=A0A562L532_9GAMM|nr:alpha/beta hydrolase [Luteimonas cucumeris]TWI02772.1 pimeloyl-ACP methyl ester carboxylesterase [Luteimonas cucumeris]